MKLISFSQFFFGSSSFRLKVAAAGCNERRRWRRGWSSVPAAASCLRCWWILRHSNMSGEGAGECMEAEDEPTTPTDGAPTTPKRAKFHQAQSREWPENVKYNTPSKTTQDMLRFTPTAFVAPPKEGTLWDKVNLSPQFRFKMSLQLFQVVLTLRLCFEGCSHPPTCLALHNLQFFLGATIRNHEFSCVGVPIFLFPHLCHSCSLVSIFLLAWPI